MLKNNWRWLTEAVVKAVAEYIGVPYKQEEIEEYYKVVSGDSLWSISKKYGLTVDELKRLNNLTSNNLSIGQLLKVSDVEVLPKEYIVKLGDTLYSIARENNISVDELKRINNLSDNAISPGQKLRLNKVQNEEPNQNETPEEVTEYFVYTIKKGDNLYTLARIYNTSVDEIAKLNNLKTNLLNIGEKIKIPTNTENVQTYSVKSGDNLYSIARRFNRTADELKRLNNLTTNLLSVGQVLKV